MSVVCFERAAARKDRDRDKDKDRDRDRNFHGVVHCCVLELHSATVLCLGSGVLMHKGYGEGCLGMHIITSFMSPENAGWDEDTSK